MINYLFASHGEFAKGTVSFLKIMMGVGDNIYTLCAFEDDQPLPELVKTTLDSIDPTVPLIIFCDLHGGSVSQEIYRQASQLNRDIKIIAGYNLALVLDIMIKNRGLTSEEIKKSIEESKEATVFLNDFSTSDDDNLFN